ncbi:MAG: nucleotidyltransferase domain-containing protein [Thermoprotei archaeon]
MQFRPDANPSRVETPISAIPLILLVKLSDVLERLRAFRWSDYGVRFAVLFGSLAKKGEGNDVDIAVSKIDPETYLRLYLDLQDYLDTEKVDLVTVDEDTDCYLVHEVFNNSLILYAKDQEAKAEMRRIASICEDFLIDARKLDLVGRSVRAVMRRWQS